MKYGLLSLILFLLTVPHLALAGALDQLQSKDWANRNINSIKVPMPSRPPMVPSGSKGVTGALSGAAAAGKASSTLGALGMGLQLLDMLDSIGNTPTVDNTQQLLEQQRMEQEHLQQLRQQSAEQLRSSWDQADAAHSASIDGVLDVPIRSGTAFFGIPGNPDGGVLPGQPTTAAATTTTATPVATTPATPATAPTTTPRPVRQNRNYSASEPVEPHTTTELIPAHTEILNNVQEYSRKFAKDVFVNTLEKSIAFLPKQWNAEMIYEHKKKMGTFIEDIFTTLDPKRLVNTLANGTPAEMAQLERDISSKTTDSARRLGFGETILDDEDLTFMMRVKQGEMSAGEAWKTFKGRVHSTLVDKTSDRILYGGGD